MLLVIEKDVLNVFFLIDQASEADITFVTYIQQIFQAY